MNTYPQPPLSIAIISGSSRPNSRTLKVCTYLQDSLNTKQVSATVWDLATQPLALNSSPEEETEPFVTRLQEFQTILSQADGVIVTTPEWDGAATPATMNALSLTENTIAHKPTLIVSVSSGRGGAYPITQIRSFGFKNNKTVFVPDHLIIRDIKHVLNTEFSPSISYTDLLNKIESNPMSATDTEQAHQKADLYIRARIEWSLDNLLLYVQALKPMRETNIDKLISDQFEHGM